MKNKKRTLAIIALLSPLGACAPTSPPDPTVKAAEAPAPTDAPLKPLTSLNDARIREGIALLANRQRSFGFFVLRATTRDIVSASIGGPVRIPSGLFGYTGADRYCVQAEFSTTSSLYAGHHGVVFFVEPKGPGNFRVTTSDANPLVSALVKSEPCGSVPMEPFPELMAVRKRFLASG